MSSARITPDCSSRRSQGIVNEKGQYNEPNPPENGTKIGNIKWIKFPRSDGNPNKAPTLPCWRKVEDNLEPTLKGPLVKWYRGIGEALAREFRWKGISIST